MAAASAANQLFRFCEPSDVGDPEAFFAAVIGIFLEFPIPVMMLVADPVHGLSSRVRRPHLTDIRTACEDAYAPIARKLMRQRALPPPPPPEPGPKMTIAEIEAKLGRPLSSLAKRMDEPQRRSKDIEECFRRREAILEEGRRHEAAGSGGPEPPKAA